MQLVQLKSFSTKNCRKWSQRIKIFCMAVDCNQESSTIISDFWFRPYIVCKKRREKLSHAGRQIVLQWISSHCGIPCNGLTDKVAKEASKLTLELKNNQPISFEIAKPSLWETLQTLNLKPSWRNQRTTNMWTKGTCRWKKGKKVRHLSNSNPGTAY